MPSGEFGAVHDWFEVTEAGVGTNRYAYAGGYPVNASDPGGNQTLGSWIASLFSGPTGNWQDAQTNASAVGNGMVKTTVNSAYNAASFVGNTVVEVSPIGTARELIGAVKSGDPMRIGMAVAGVIPWGKAAHVVGQVFRGAEESAGVVYRGVKVGHPGYDDALDGIVIPGDVDGVITAEQHNAGSVSGFSPFTSWTRDFGIAEQYAGEGGVILRAPLGAPPIAGNG